jgi:prevent-host-death family protein
MAASTSSQPESINVHAAKTHFSKLLARVEKGEEIVIARDGKPVAKLVPVEVPKPRKKAPPGFAKDLLLHLPDDLTAPDPEIEAMFNDAPLMTNEKGLEP